MSDYTSNQNQNPKKNNARIARKVTYIYALREPESGDIRYIGKTVNLKRRYYRHLHEFDNTHRSRWIQKLVREGEAPTLVLLETVGIGQDWAEVEKRWIQHGRDQGWNLVNSTDGGDGVVGYVLTKADRKKISAALKGRTKSADHRAKVGLASIGRIDGVKNPKAVLLPMDILAIRNLYATGEYTQADLADQFGITKGHISKIVLGKVWPDIGGPIADNQNATKLTQDDAELIRDLYAGGNVSQGALAERFGVSQAIVWGIVNNKRWVEPQNGNPMTEENER